MKVDVLLGLQGNEKGKGKLWMFLLRNMMW